MTAKKTQSPLVGRVVILTKAGEEVVEHWQSMGYKVDDPSPLSNLYNTEGEVVDSWREDGARELSLLILGGDHAGTVVNMGASWVLVIRDTVDEKATWRAEVKASAIAIFAARTRGGIREGAQELTMKAVESTADALMFVACMEERMKMQEAMGAEFTK